MTDRWILGPRGDLLWILGGLLAGYALFAAHAAFRIDLLAVWFGWMLALDGPHVFATLTRTYFLRDEWSRRPAVLLSGLGLAALPIAVLVVSRPSFYGLLAIVNLWGFWHVVRQHEGLLRLYGRRSGDAPAEAGYDRLLLYAALAAPFAALVTRHPEARAAIGWTAEVPPVAATAVVVAAGLLYAARQILHRRPNVPKLLFLGLLVPFYPLVCLHPSILSAPLMGVVPILTISHDIHYHAMVRFYHRNRGTAAGWHSAGGLALGALLAVLGCTLDAALPVGAALRSSVELRESGLAVFHGFFIHHYFIDGFIWKPSRDPSVREGLALGA